MYEYILSIFNGLTMRRCILPLLILFLCSGCSSTAAVMRPDANSYARTPSYAISQNVDTPLRRMIQPKVRQYPDQSGFRILETGVESLQMRLAMVRAAQKTIDLQYYAINDDTTSNLLLQSILHASDRGVRVRFLIDGVSLGKVGDSLSALDNNKNIEIRVFNPLTTRNQSLVSGLFGLFTDSAHATRRMHNKAMIADNQTAIVGGRNLGDEYFDSDPEVDFKDLDILAAGPVVAKISDSFDQYWNGNNSFPIAALHRPIRDPATVNRIKAMLRDHWAKMMHTPQGKKKLTGKLTDGLHDGKIKLSWARAEVAADAPFKIDQDESDTTSKPLLHLNNLLQKADHEFLLTSPYFVPQDEGVKYLGDLVHRGIKVSVLTNSLASTDVVMAHTGYTPYRRDLLNNGINIYELKPVNGQRSKQRLLATSAPAYAALHSKVYVIDRKDVVIGSFNFDPRSIDINTEIALVIHSPQIAAQVTKLFEDSTSPENSYRLVIDKKGNLVWVAREKGQNVYYTHDPKAGFWRSIEADVMSILPVEDQL